MILHHDGKYQEIQLRCLHFRCSGIIKSYRTIYKTSCKLSPMNLRSSLKYKRRYINQRAKGHNWIKLTERKLHPICSKIQKTVHKSKVRVTIELKSYWKKIPSNMFQDVLEHNWATQSFVGIQLENEQPVCWVCYFFEENHKL
jgi:hypothetical protein